MQQTEAHVPALDGVRGLAIALVIARHLSAVPALRTSQNGVDRIVESVTGAGWVGVDLFFVLSGFLITGILIRERDRMAPAGQKLGRFYWRRFLRIAPLYFAACAVLFFVVPALPYFRAQPEIAVLHHSEPWYWLYAVNILEIVRGGATPFNTGHFWSLSVEEQFYLIWPFVVLAISRKALARLIAGLIIVGPLIRLALLATLDGRSGPTAAYTLSLARVDVLGAGALLAVMSRENLLQNPRVRIAIPWIATAAAAVFVAISITHGAAESHGALMQTVGYTATAIGMGTLIASTLVPGSLPAPLAHMLRATPLRTFGKYSYCLYVVHYPLMTVMDLVWAHVRIPSLFGSSLPSWLVYGIALTSCSFAIAWMSWRVLESPMLALKDRFGERFSARHSTAPAAWAPTPERIAE